MEIAFCPSAAPMEIAFCPSGAFCEENDIETPASEEQPEPLPPQPDNELEPNDGDASVELVEPKLEKSTMDVRMASELAITTPVAGAAATATTSSGSSQVEFSDTSALAIIALGCKVLFSLGADEDAMKKLSQNRIFAICQLMCSVALPIADSVSDVLLTVEWLTGDQQWYGRMSLSILIVSELLPAGVFFVAESNLLTRDRIVRAPVYDWEEKTFNPFLGFVISMTGMRLPANAAIQIYEIATNGVGDEYILSAGQRESDARTFLTGATGIMCLKCFELLCETTSELFLQTYKGGHDHFVKDEEPSRLLKMSISISLCTLASGVAGAQLNMEQFMTKALATVYFLACLVARFAVMVSMFVAFGKKALGFALGAYFLRVCMTVTRIGVGGGESGILNAAGIFDHILIFFLPLGTRKSEQYGDHLPVSIWGPVDSPVVKDKLTSPWALGNLALTIVESAIGWTCILRADSLIPFFEFVRFGLVPTGIMLAALPLTYASAYFCPAAEGNYY